MQRVRSASLEFKSDAKRQQRQQEHTQRGGSASAPRRAVVSDAPQDEVVFYTQRLKEIAAQQAKLEREYHQRTTANRRLVRQMHDENTHLRTIRAVSTDVTAAELEQLEQRKFLEIRRLNRLTHQLEKTEREIREAEETRALNNQVFFEPSQDGVSGNRSVVLRIQKFEKLLDQTLANQQRVEGIRKVYAEVLEELQETKFRSCSPVSMLERDIEARRRDYAKVVLMYSNALTDHRYAQEELRKFNEAFHQARRLKDKTLAERRERVERTLRETQRLELREVELQQELAEEQQRTEEVHAEREARARRRRMSVSAVERLSAAPSIDHTLTSATLVPGGSPEEEERVQAYENSFRKMMRATESTTIDELITKFELEYAARQQLKNQIREEEERLEQLREEVRKMKGKTEQRSLHSVAQPHVTLTLREDLLVYLEDAARERDIAMEKSARLQELLSEVVRRVNVLADNLAVYRSEVCVPPTQASNLVTNIELVGQKILSLADETVGRGETQAGVDSMLVVVPEGNTRIKLPPTSTSNPVWAANSNATRSGGVSDTDICSYGIVPSVVSKDYDVSTSSSASEDEEVAKDGDHTVSLLSSDEPLSREQIKRLAAVVVRREARLRQREERRR